MTTLEQRILQAVADLGEDAYTLPIYRRANGSLDGTCDTILLTDWYLWEMYERGLVNCRDVGDTPKLLWWLTGPGRRALEGAR